MDDFQQQMNAILGNPEMMQKIMSMAQSLNSPDADPIPQKPDTAPLQDMDMSMLKKFSGLAGSATIDKNQRSLLSALSPYLSQQRLRKLEKAMRAAKMATLASSFLSNSGFGLPSGR